MGDAGCVLRDLPRGQPLARQSLLHGRVCAAQRRAPRPFFYAEPLGPFSTPSLSAEFAVEHAAKIIESPQALTNEGVRTMGKKTDKRILANFQPQSWINDYAVNIDGAYEFDVTKLILAMGRSEALEISDCDQASDNLWRDWVSAHPDKDHDGPFSVTVEDSIKGFFIEPPQTAAKEGV